MCARETCIYNTTSHLRRDEMRNHKILIFYMPFVLVLGLFHKHIEPVSASKHRWSCSVWTMCFDSSAQVDKLCVSLAWLQFLYTFTDSHALLILQYIISSHLSIISNGNTIFTIHIFANSSLSRTHEIPHDACKMSIPSFQPITKQNKKKSYTNFANRF